MDITELTSATFWQSDQCHMMVNPRDGESLAEMEILKPWVDQQSALAGHVLFSTSGSSGRSKWVALSREALLASARRVNQFLSTSSQDRWLLALPYFHVGGMGVLARSYVASCQVIDMDGKWDASAYHAKLMAEKITLSALVPAQLVDLVQRGLFAPGSLRAVLIGGGRLDDAVYRQAVDLGWPVMETYGMTEASSQIATAELGARDLKVLPGWAVKTNKDGRLVVKGEALLSGYVSRQGEIVSLENPKDDGWFVTSDLALVENNTIVLKGRADRCVKVLGELVNLAEVEKRLSNIVAASGQVSGFFAVVSVPDQRAGNRLVLCMENGWAYANSLAHYNEECHPVERIDSVFITEKIPRSPLGKTLYAELSGLIA